MPRAQRLATLLTIFIAIWSALFFDIVQIPGLGPSATNRLLAAVPMGAIAMLATYCFVELASGVLGMGDATQAHKELLQDIAAAKQDLASKGIHID